ncbi:MAG: hypothetical protein PHO92_03350 [Candidatus Peribacteraceae bacterium]|nr:hypothetical protein [Candidatus Peribacteraceae bacterium]
MIVSSALVSLFLHQVTLPRGEPAIPATGIVAEQRTGTLSVRTEDAALISSIAAGSQRVPMLAVSLAASCEADVPVVALTVVRSGLGAHADIQAVYAEEGGRRLSSARTVDSRDGSVQLRLRNFAVPACEARTVRVLVDFSPDAALAGEHRLLLAPVSPVDAGDASVTVQESVLPLVRRTAGSVRGSVDLSMRDVSQRISYGEQRRVARFLLSARGREWQEVRAIRFTNQGSARGSDLQNLSVVTSTGKRISGVAAALEGDSVSIVFNPPLLLSPGQERVLELRADVRASIRKTIRFTVEEPSDVIARPARQRGEIAQ